MQSHVTQIEKRKYLYKVVTKTLKLSMIPSKFSNFLNAITVTV